MYILDEGAKCILVSANIHSAEHLSANLVPIGQHLWEPRVLALPENALWCH